MNQVSIEDQVTVGAPISKVWEAIKNPTTHSQWHPFASQISGEHRLGAVRKCEVHVGDKPGHTEERCTSYDEGKKIIWTIEKDSSGFSRMVSDWSAGFSLEPRGSNTTVVTAQSIFSPKTFFVRLMMPMIRRKFHRFQQAILSGLKQYVEK
ncbi:MAG: SRPBCC family protein [Chloroflexi bacterium]|nr:SRPBCC family protein [Chloroflexota bacterium]